MQTVGQILKETREIKFYTLEDVEKAIKIRRELLVALEEDNFQKLPPPTFVRGFIRNYAKFLGLDSNKILAIYRREYAEDKHIPYIMDAFSKPLSKPRFKLTPSQILGGAIIIIVMMFFVYLWLQYRQFVGTPNLNLTTPQDQATTENESLLVEGKTDPEMKVFVNNQEIQVDPNGNFKVNINLISQVNKITVSSVSKFGQKAEVERTVYLKR